MTGKGYQIHRIAIMLFFLSLTSLLSGCGRDEEETTGFYIYCLDTNETKLEQEEYTPQTETGGDGLVTELINSLKKEPATISFKKAIPDDVDVDEFTLTESGDLSLYLSASYGNYTSVSEILRRAAIVKTLCQIPDVSNVQLYVAGQPLTDSSMNAVGFMNDETFVDNTSGSSYTQTATMTIYFSNLMGNGLIAVPVEITYDALIPMEQLVLEQLIRGPNTVEGIRHQQYLDTVPEGTRINTISVKEKTCYVDLSADFLEKRDNVTDEVTIYSVVNTLVELPNINKVQFSIDGEQVLLYDDAINFAEPFQRNLDIVS